MVLENFCRNCGKRILPNEQYCQNCGSKTIYDDAGVDCIFIFPIHDVGFFNFDIDFSPFIESARDDFKYEICSCGYLNETDDEYCFMCGAKKSKSRLSKFIKSKSRKEVSFDNVLCDCGHINNNENTYCEMCGKQLREDADGDDNYSNFNLEFDESIFCLCGEENDKFSLFCRNCGLPLVNYGKQNDIQKLCTCSTLNEVSSEFCMECGCNLDNEDSKIVCVCGNKNDLASKFCDLCERPLNPKRIIKSKIICSCGQVLEWDSDFCYNCGKNIKKAISRKVIVNKTIKNIKNTLR